MYIDKSLTLPEIFDRVSKQKTTQEKVNLLQKYNNRVLTWFVGSLYQQTYSDLPEPKEWTKSTLPVGLNYMSLKHAKNKLDSALKLYNEGKQDKAETELVLALENVHKDEADLILKLINGKKAIKGVSKTVFVKAYPSFFVSEDPEK